MKAKTEMTIMNRLKGKSIGDVELHLDIYRAYFASQELYHKLRRMKHEHNIRSTDNSSNCVYR